MGLIERVKSNGLLYRAIIVGAALMSLSFAGTTYYHYKINAATDYLCIDSPVLFGRPVLDGYQLCQPIDSYDMYLKDEHGSQFTTLHIIDRLFTGNPRIHISNLYLERKYPLRSEGFIGLGTDQALTKQQVIYNQKKKQGNIDFQSELLLLKSDINKSYEVRFIVEALAFAGKLTLLLPFSLIALSCIVIGIKSFILHGRIKVAR